MTSLANLIVSLPGWEHLLVFGIELVFAILLIAWLRSNRRGRSEPWSFMLAILLYGVIAAGLAAFVEIRYSFNLHELQNISPELALRYGSYLELLNNFAASLIEELGKYSIAIFTVISSRHFHKMTDAILYLVLIGLGFSLIEDAIFLLNPATPAVYRLMSFYVHSGTSAVIGYSLGRFRYGLGGYRELGWAVAKAVLLHFAYNTATTIHNDQVSFIVTLAITLYISSLIFILYRRALKEEYRLEHPAAPNPAGQRLLNLKA